MFCFRAISSQYNSDDLSIMHNKVPNPCKTQEGIPGTAIYPACFLWEFLLRGNVPAPRFAYPNGLPMLHFEFDALLKQLLHFCGYDTCAFKGDSDVQIRAAGRWTLDAFKKYIRFS